MNKNRTVNEISDGTSEILKIINGDNSINLDWAKAFTFTLMRESADLANSLPNKTIGEYSYYEGQINGLKLALRILEKLNLEDIKNVG